MDTTVAASYLRGTFDAADRIALVLLHRPTGQLIQRFATVAAVAGPRWQAWLRFQNAHAYEVYYSIHAYRHDAHRRTKASVSVIRHIFLDVDGDADRVVAAIRGDPRLPPPHHIVSSSPGRCQVLWRVCEFTPTQAEALQRDLAITFGTDLAATDTARVARLPGLFNHKYPRPYFVRVTIHENLTPLSPTAFPRITPAASHHPASERTPSVRRSAHHSQSERDWQWVMRQLAGGRPVEPLERTLVQRRPDKRHRVDYAARTVDAAWVQLSLAAGRAPCILVQELIARRQHRQDAVSYAEHIVRRALTRLAPRSATGLKEVLPCAS